MRDRMKKVGIILIFAGLSLIVALSMNVARKDRSVITIENGVASRELGFMRLFTTVGTVLVIAGISATVLAKSPDNF